MFRPDRDRVSDLLALDLPAQADWLLERSIEREVELARGALLALTDRERLRLERLRRAERRQRGELLVVLEGGD